MFNLSAVVILLLLSFVSLSGCATTTSSQSDLEIQSLRNQISILQAQVRNRDEELYDLREAIRQPAEGDSAAAARGSGIIDDDKPFIKPKAKMIQTALKNAGYNPGEIDGKIGMQTKQAIMSFQRDHNLKVDGRAGKNTWQILSQFVNK